MHKCHKDQCMNRKMQTLRHGEKPQARVSAKATNFNAWGNVCKTQQARSTLFQGICTLNLRTDKKIHMREKNEGKKAADYIA